MRSKPPQLTPQQKRDVLVASYLDSYRRAGMQVTADQVTRQVIADCELVDAADRAGELRGPGTPSSKPKRKRRVNELERATQETGVRVMDRRDAPVIWRPSFMFKNPQQVSDRWGFAVARIARITESGTEHGALAELAREYKATYARFLLRNRGLRDDAFAGLNDRDSARKFMRIVEDICDRSTGVLGSWYTR